MFPLQNKYAPKAAWLELGTLCPSSHQMRWCSELPGSVYTCACFKVGSAHRVPTKLRNSKCLLQFYKDFLIGFSSALPSLPSIHLTLSFRPSSCLLAHPLSRHPPVPTHMPSHSAWVSSCPQALPAFAPAASPTHCLRPGRTESTVASLRSGRAARVTPQVVPSSLLSKGQGA